MRIPNKIETPFMYIVLPELINLGFTVIDITEINLIFGLFNVFDCRFNPPFVENCLLILRMKLKLKQFLIKN